MNPGFLYSLTPKPITISTGTLSGRLLVDGNIGENLLLFRFLFDIADDVAPLYIQIEVLEKVYLYFCDIRDFSNPVMKSPVIKTEFELKNKIKVLNVEPMVLSNV